MYLACPPLPLSLTHTHTHTHTLSLSLSLPLPLSKPIKPSPAPIYPTNPSHDAANPAPTGSTPPALASTPARSPPSTFVFTAPRRRCGVDVSASHRGRPPWRRPVRWRIRRGAFIGEMFILAGDGEALLGWVGLVGLKPER
jgi:hypothetical protein